MGRLDLGADRPAAQCRFFAVRRPRPLRGALLRFLRDHGERRLTMATWRSLRQLTAADRLPAGAGLVIAVAGKQLIGAACGLPGGEARRGQTLGCVVVHAAFRNQGIGRRLLKELAGLSEALVCQVAADNPASLRMCSAAGLRLAERTIGPTGKPTLKLVRQSLPDSDFDINQPK